MSKKPYVNPDRVKFNITARDGWQANNGTKVTADEMTAAYANVGNYGVQSVQILGGTYTDFPIKHGRDPEEFANKIGDHYKEQGIEERSALWRGECGTSYSRQPADVLRSNIRMHLKAGVNVFENFHAMNDINMMRSIPAMVKEEAKKLGVEAKVKGTITIQENPDTLARKDEIIEELRQFARKLVETGHEDFYIKNANGVMTSPEFITDIVQMLKEEFPDQKIGFHMHNTYGHAPKIYNAAIKAGVDSVDVLPDALAEGTAQPGISSIMNTMKHSGDEAISSRMPEGIKMDEIAKDQPTQYYTRAKYSDTEMAFNPAKRKIAEAAGSAGGAIAALKGIQSVFLPLSSTLKTDNWDIIQDALYKQKTENRAVLGYPTNVTPHELMQDLQAAMDVVSVTNGGKAFDIITGGTIEYLSGQLGRVSPTANPKIQNRAIKQAIATMGDEIERMSPDTHGYKAKMSMYEDLIASDKLYKEGGLTKAIEHPMTLPNVEDLEPGLPIARDRLIEGGIPNPTDKQILIASISKEGVEFVKGNIKPLQEPEVAKVTKEGEAFYDIAPLMYKVVYDAVEIKKSKAGFYQGVNGLDERVENLERQIKEGLNIIQEELKTKVNVQVCNFMINKFAKERGADIKDIPLLELKNNMSFDDDQNNSPPSGTLYEDEGKFNNKSGNISQSWMSALDSVSVGTHVPGKCNELPQATAMVALPVMANDVSNGKLNSISQSMIELGEQPLDYEDPNKGHDYPEWKEHTRDDMMSQEDNEEYIKKLKKEYGPEVGI